MWIVSLPVQAATARPGASNVSSWFLILGVVIWVVGFLFETVGDVQTARFKADPASKTTVMDRGLWRYTRHPNYFGDFCASSTADRATRYMRRTNTFFPGPPKA